MYYQPPRVCLKIVLRGEGTIFRGTTFLIGVMGGMQHLLAMNEITSFGYDISKNDLKHHLSCVTVFYAHVRGQFRHISGVHICCAGNHLTPHKLVKPPRISRVNKASNITGNNVLCKNIGSFYMN